MNADQKGIPLRSNPEVYSLSNGIAFKTDFLAQARNMAAPEITEIDFVLEGTVGGVTATALGRDAAKLLDTIQLFDGEERVNLSGAGQRVWEQMELGNRRRDPATVASGATNTAYKYRWRLPFCSVDKAYRGDDFSIPLTDLLEGGQIRVQTPAAVPTGFAAVQSDWKLTCYAYVRDARVREAKARRRLREEQVTQQEYDYQIHGSLRAAILTSKLTTTGYTELLALYSTLNSRTLKWPANYDVFDIIDNYLYNTNGIDNSGPSSAVADEFLLTATTAGAICLVCPDRSQKTGQMIDTATMHLDLRAAAPTGGRLITDVVTDRRGDQNATWLGFASPGEAMNAVMNRGKVNGGDGREYDLKGFNAQLSKRMPVRLKS
jgi:hypothetical protein